MKPFSEIVYILYSEQSTIGTFMYVTYEKKSSQLFALNFFACIMNEKHCLRFPRIHFMTIGNGKKMLENKFTALKQWRYLNNKLMYVHCEWFYFMQKDKKETSGKKNDFQSEVVDILFDPWKNIYLLLFEIYFYVECCSFFSTFIFAVCKGVRPRYSYAYKVSCLNIHW